MSQPQNIGGPIDAVAEQLAAVVLDLHSQHTLDGTLNAICHLAVDFVDGAQDASVSVLRGRGLRTLAASGEIGEQLDRLQCLTGEGPGADVIREQHTLVSGDLRTESRWPRFGPAATAQTGVRSVASFRLCLDGDTLGALTLYSRSADAFGDTDLRAGTVFAAHAAVAYDDARLRVKVANLEIALVTARRIGMALGVLMAVRKIDDTEAFALLQHASQASHRKLRDIAEDIIATGAVPI